MAIIESIVIAGSSGAGKTTTINGLRMAPISERLIFPQRFITRQRRLNDDLTENYPISHGLFNSMVGNGDIDVFWDRDTPGGLERYGFKQPETTGRLSIYSANNSFLKSGVTAVRRVLERAAVVVVQADPVVREARIRSRSPDLDEAEVQARLQSEADVDDLPESTPLHVIRTDELGIAAAQAVLIGLVHDYLHPA